jgi:hypothetical protein
MLQLKKKVKAERARCEKMRIILETFEGEILGLKQTSNSLRTKFEGLKKDEIKNDSGGEKRSDPENAENERPEKTDKLLRKSLAKLETYEESVKGLECE